MLLNFTDKYFVVDTLECGNSESNVRRSTNEAESEAESEADRNVIPKNSSHSVGECVQIVSMVQLRLDCCALNAFLLDEHSIRWKLKWLFFDGIYIQKLFK